MDVNDHRPDMINDDQYDETNDDYEQRMKSMMTMMMVCRINAKGKNTKLIWYFFRLIIIIIEITSNDHQ